MEVAVLVLLEVRMQPDLGGGAERVLQGVAVLVLLEVRMQPMQVWIDGWIYDSCSPCFAGSSYATLYSADEYDLTFAVAVLVLLEVRMQPCW